MYAPIAANFGYTPNAYGNGMPMPNRGSANMIASDGTLSLAGVADAVTRILQRQAQQVNQLQQQNDPTLSGGGSGGAQGQGQGQGGGQGAGGVGSASMLALQKATSEYTTALQQGTSIMSGLADTHKAVAQNTK
ncbi:hypothetical protein [Paraburkholderia bannensis]|uniref:hypothetical protein n=1 Tax=Paraburkholderia bannensis TaxID=765414 RepID=UPI002AC33C2B|nr:hypothetical protein [Paraburkholderia bannensis]